MKCHILHVFEIPTSFNKKPFDVPGSILLYIPGRSSSVFNFNGTKSAEVCLPLLPPISDQVITQLRGHFSFIFEYFQALGGV